MSKLIPIARPFFGEEEVRAVEGVIGSRWVCQGPKVQEFEEAFARQVGAREAVAVSSGTTALYLALYALGIGPGDEVICPSYSFVATANTVMHVGANPRFVDIDPRYLNMDPSLIEGAVTERTRAIMAVHQVGVPLEMEGVRDVARRRGLLIIEDAACALGSRIGAEAVGAPHGDGACFSFHPRKVITTGEGGMITVKDPGLADRMRRLRQHDLGRLELVAFNFRMTDMQAALGLVQLGRLEDLLARRGEIAGAYTQAFSGVEGLQVPEWPKGTTPNHQSYQLRLQGPWGERRGELIAFLESRGISTREGIPSIHLLPPYRDLHGAPLVETERASREIIMLPLFHEMRDEEVSRVIEGLLEWTSQI